MSSDPVTGQAASGAAAPLASNRRELLLGLGSLFAAFVVSVLLSRHSHRVSEPVFSKAPEPASTSGLVGFPAQVDVLGNLAAARLRTARIDLVGIEARAVTEAGTVDVSTGTGEIRYTFQSAAGQGPQPPRRAGTLPARHYCGSQQVTITSLGLAEQKDQANAACDDALPALPAPQCGPRELWQVAKAKGVAPEHEASALYLSLNGVPVWRFEAKAAGVEFTLSAADCKTELPRP